MLYREKLALYAFHITLPSNYSKIYFYFECIRGMITHEINYNLEQKQKCVTHFYCCLS